MALHYNLRLLFASCTLFISFCLAESRLSPNLQPEASPGSAHVLTRGPAPGPADVPSPGPVLPPLQGPALAPSPSPSPSPLLGPAPEPISSPRPASVPTPSPAAGIPASSISEPPSNSISPIAAPLTDSDGPFDVEAPTTLAPSTEVDPRVKEICDATHYSSLCLATVVPYLNGKTDVPSVLELAITAGAKLTKHALSVAKNVTEEPGINAELLQTLKECSRSYERAVNNYQHVVYAFPRRDKGTMNSMLSAVMIDIGDCEDAVSAHAVESPLSSIGGRLTHMTSNCLAIVSLLD
ncbi:UNVERIFIED_CONTAM: hypothetical protein Slati_1088100 [Sesamum latifolium]|uniref:Pectinesterase inhibitor domain-containing protein n=1 Tax=Sesamum latifolium TaxID=2727402 RepID=A0AAW2XTL8_9LAMI